MSSLLPQLLEHLAGAPTKNIGQSLGLDESAASSAITAALPVILGGLANNTQSSDGASALGSALDRDHDGSILNDLAGMALGAAASNGDGILGHIFGGNRNQATAAVEKSTGGLDAATAAKLMAVLAPIVLGYLGKKKRESNLDSGALAKELQVESQAHGPEDTSLGSMVSKMLDQDGDGSAMDDVLRIGGGLLAKWRS